MEDKNRVFNVVTVIKNNDPAASQRRWSSARAAALKRHLSQIGISPTIKRK